MGTVMRWVLVGAVVLLAGGVSSALWAAGEADDLGSARAAFERHNYRAALEIVDRVLARKPSGAELVGARALRGQCLLKQRQWEEGIGELEGLLAGQAEVPDRAALHEALGEVGLARHQYRYLAVVHYDQAAVLHEKSGDARRAAETLIKQAEAFVGFSHWDRWPEFDGQKPAKWREERRLQRKYALAALDRAIALAGKTDLAAEATFQKAKLYHLELRTGDEDFDVALKLYAEVWQRWPKSNRAAEALYQAANLLAHHKEDYVAAVERYRELARREGGSSWGRRAKREIQQITTAVIEIAVGGPVLPGEAGEIQYRTRNVKEVSLRAYRVDLFKLIRSIGHIRALDKWRAQGRPEAEWKLAIPDTGKHRWYASQDDGLSPTELPVQEAGAYVVEAHGKGLKSPARMLMLVSQLACLSKGARSQTLVYAADAVSGAAARDAEVLIQRRLEKDRYDYETGRTDETGRYHRGHKRQTKPGSGREAMILVRQDEHYAIAGSSFYWYWWGYGQPYRVYTFTERPVYRPDQVIHFKTILREYDEGEYGNAPGKAFTLEVRDPRGEVVQTRKLKTNQDGTASGEFRLPDGAPLGVYWMAVKVDGHQLRSDGGERFRVEEYRKPEYEVTVKADRPDYRVGEPADVRIEARYYFGEPVVDAKVKAVVFRSSYRPYFPIASPWRWYFDQYELRGRRSYWPGHRRTELVGQYELTTDESGVALVHIDTKPIEGQPEADLLYEIEAEVTDVSRRVITGSGSIKVTRAPFYLHVRPQQYVYQPGDTVRLEIEAKGPNDDPIAAQGTLCVHRLRSVTDTTTDPPQTRQELAAVVSEQAIATDAAGRAQVKWVADEEGPFRVVVTAGAKDDADEQVSGDCDVWIAKRGGRFEHYAYRDVELIADRDSYAVGDTARILVNTRYDDCRVLVTVEADDLLDDRVVETGGGTYVLELPITPAYVPNCELTATVLRDEKVFQDQVRVVVPPVDRFLSVEVKTPSKTYHPREETTVEVRTTDSAGKPAPAEVAVMMVDASIYYIQPEFREQIEKFFYGQLRPHLVRTQTSYDYYGSGHGEGRLGFVDRDREVTMLGEEAPMAAQKALPAARESGMADEEAGEFAVAEVRKEFPDTVLWAAHLTTGDDGEARKPVTLPDTLTTWRIHAIAIDRETRVGQAASDVVTRKDVIARLQAPRFLVEGDLPLLTVIAHNYLPQDKKVRVTLEATGQLDVGEPFVGGAPVPDGLPGEAVVTVPAGGELAVDFPTQVLEPGEAQLTATVAADVDADAIQIETPVLIYGANRFTAVSGVVRKDDPESLRSVHVDIPERITPGSQRLQVHVNPSIATVMIDALPFLLDYPYGCTEQTLSRFVPAVVVRRTLQKLGIDLGDVRRRLDTRAERGQGPGAVPHRYCNNPVFDQAAMNDMIRKGLERISELQKSDGGWGWWAGGVSNPYMTAYAVYGLTEARDADVAFDQNMLERGVAFLKQRVVSTEAASRYSWRRDDDNVRAWMLYALSCYDGALPGQAKSRAVLDRIYEDRDGLTDYSRAMLMIVLHRLGDEDRVQILTENLYNTVRLDDELQTASWGDAGGYRYWYDNGLEATSMVLRALLATNPEHEYVPRSVNWLVRNRRGSRWFSTKDTAQAVYALSDYLVTSGELDAEMTVSVDVGGRVTKEFAITPAEALTFDGVLEVSAGDLPPGRHEVRISREGAGNVYYAVYLDYFTREDPIEPAGHDVYVTREYTRLIPKEVTRTREVWDPQKRAQVTQTYPALDYDRQPIHEREALTSGDLIEVKLQIEAKNNFEYLIFEDPKPAGCEPVELRSGRSAGAPFCDHFEVRDQKTAFFATYLSQGTHELTYRLRCETPGTFHALPARAEAMYTPYVRANGASDVIEIESE